MSSRLEEAVRALRQAHVEASRTEVPLSADTLVLEAQNGLILVLQEIEAGAYVPSREEARASLDLAADAASFGWPTGELRRLFRAALRAL